MLAKVLRYKSILSGMGPKLCERCNLAMTLNGKYKYCTACQQAVLDEEAARPLCKSEGCTKKASLVSAYCGKHGILAWKEGVEARGKKVCSGYTRTCRAELELSYAKQKCPACLEKDRAKEKKRKEELDKLPELDGLGNKKCSTCSKYAPLAEYVGIKTDVIQCKACRDTNKRGDSNRNKEHRNELERVAAKRPGRMATKQEWAKFNHDKVLAKDRKHKAKVMLADPEAALEKGREQAAAFRAKNPEKMEEANRKRRMSKDSAFCVYKNSASAKNLLFDMTKERFMEIVEKPCHYCGCKNDERGFHGIDRLDCRVGYTEANSVPCCTMCNLLKASLTEEVFLMRVEHICGHLGLAEGRRWPVAFPCSMGALYTGVKARANKLKVAFDLTLEFFVYLHQRGCYLCGKTNVESGAKESRHRNGTDRVLNTEGYVMTNVRPCCGQCNYMKKDFALDVFQAKLLRIYEFRNIASMTFDNSLQGGMVHSIQPHLNKVSKEERTKAREEKKQARLARLAEEFPELAPAKG